MTQSLKQNNKANAFLFNGKILFAPMQSTVTYLINKYGDVDHTWQSDYTPGQSVYMLQDGSILRTIRLTYSAPGGAGGGVQKITWNGLEF